MEQYSAHRTTHLYRIYSNPTHDKHQWLLLQFIVLLKMDAKGVRNMQSILVVFNKHNTARVASCWFIMYILQIYDARKLKYKYYILEVCACSLSYPAFSTHAPYYIVIRGLPPALQYFSTLFHKRHDFRKNFIAHKIYFHFLYYFFF